MRRALKKCLWWIAVAALLAVSAPAAFALLDILPLYIALLGGLFSLTRWMQS